MSYKHDPTEYRREYQRMIRAETIATLGGCCQECGYTGVALQIDHVDGDGNLQKCPGGKRYWYATKKAILDGQTEGLQLLCANCHVEKTLAQGDHLPRSQAV